MSYYIASVSWGKDSLAMLLRLIYEKKPLDEVVFLIPGWNSAPYTMCAILPAGC